MRRCGEWAGTHRKRSVADGALYGKRRTMTAPLSCLRQRRQLDAGGLQAEISSFRLYLAAEGKSAKTVRTYPAAPQQLLTRPKKSLKPRVIIHSGQYVLIANVTYATLRNRP